MGEGEIVSSAQLGRVIVASLIEYGVDSIVLCPGSRSTSIALALAEAQKTCSQGKEWTIYRRTEERSAAFTALGLAKARGIAAIIVTSGTAVGNLLPAIMEAYHSQIPLLVITADRPSTLIGSGANQTTYQNGIFPKHLVHEIFLSSSDRDERAWVAAMGVGIIAARGQRSGRRGPVQINVAMSDPFIDGQIGQWPSIEPIRVSSRCAQQCEVDLSKAVVLAADADEKTGKRARRFAEKYRLPLFAEPSSNARYGPCAIRSYRELLDGDLAHQIQTVIVYGHPTLSRPVSRLLASSRHRIVAMSDSSIWHDSGHNVSVVADEIIPTRPDCIDEGWLRAWKEADLERNDCGSSLSCASLVDTVVEYCSSGLFFGPSMVIRHADLSPIRTTAIPVWANRGLAGIDGICSTAAGVALGSREPITVLVGDLTFLHDLTSLIYISGEKIPDMRIIVADDNGGAIFTTLEVGDLECVEDLFVMPHGLDLARLAAGFGWTTRRVATRDQLISVLSEPCEGIDIVIASFDAVEGSS